jgi:1,4-alpha-glucan branching enzyme
LNILLAQTGLKEGEITMPQRSTSPPKRRKVTFYCDAPGATNVAVVGTFNAWDPIRHPMHHGGGGRWNKSLFLPPGKYEYKFWIDGRWQEDPRNSQSVSNAFGTKNSLLQVLPR